MRKSIAAILILVATATATATAACSSFSTDEPRAPEGSGGSATTSSATTSTGSATSSAGGNDGGGPGYWDCASGTCKPAGVGYFAPGDDTRTACGTGTYSDSTTAAACTLCTNAPANSTAVTYAASSALSSNTCPLATVICSSPRIWNGMVCQDTTPIAFSFTDLTGLAPVGVVTSDTVTPLGFEGPLTLTCTNCSALAKNGSFGGTSLTGVNPGDTITVRATAPSWNGTLDVTVQLGLSSTVWNLRSRDYQYIWLQGGFGGCTASCGGGVQTQVVSCQREDGVIVADAFCLGAKPPTNSSCNTVACPPSFSWGPSTCPSNTTWTLSISNSTPSATVAIACLSSNNNPLNVTLGSTNADGNGTFTGVAAWGTQTYMDCDASVGGTVVASIHFIP